MSVPTMNDIGNYYCLLHAQIIFTWNFFILRLILLWYGSISTNIDGIYYLIFTTKNFFKLRTILRDKDARNIVLISMNRPFPSERTSIRSVFPKKKNDKEECVWRIQEFSVRFLLATLVPFDIENHWKWLLSCGTKRALYRNDVVDRDEFTGGLRRYVCLPLRLNRKKRK